MPLNAWCGGWVVGPGQPPVYQEDQFGHHHTSATGKAIGGLNHIISDFATLPCSIINEYLAGEGVDLSPSRKPVRAASFPSTPPVLYYNTSSYHVVMLYLLYPLGGARKSSRVVIPPTSQGPTSTPPAL